jgi:hypothetical protein
MDAVPADQRAVVLAREGNDRIRNAEARELLFSTTPKGDERERIRAAVKKAGISRCWMTESPEAPRAAASTTATPEEDPQGVSVVEPRGELREGCRVDTRLAEWCKVTPWTEHEALVRAVGGPKILFARARAAHVKTCEQREAHGGKTATLAFDEDGHIIRSETLDDGRTFGATARYVAGRLAHFEMTNGGGTRVVDLKSADDEDCLQTVRWTSGSTSRNRCWRREKEGDVASVHDELTSVSRMTATSIETRPVKGYREEWDAQERTTLIVDGDGHRTVFEYGDRETRIRRDGALAWTWTLDERGLPSTARDERKGVTEKITCK